MAFFTRMVLGLLFVSVAIPGNAIAAEKAESVEIGMPRTLFHGLHESLMKIGAAPFLKMMKGQTGMEGNIQFPADTRTLAAQIDAGTVHIGVMTGYELAWAQSRYPNLVPIAVSVPMQPIQSFCLVKWDSKAKNIGDLKGEKISLPSNNRDFCDLFLDKQKNEHMKGATFAGRIDRPYADDAIYDVIEDRAGCTVVDCSALKYFQTVNPGQFQNLKILSQSEVFPNACIVVKKGELKPQTIEKFRNALLGAQDNPIGKPMLTTWKLKSFAVVPDDYARQLKLFETAYPTPAAWNASIEK